MSIVEDNRTLAEELSRYARLCYDRGLVGATGGNLSARVPGRDLFLVTASGVSLRDVAPANLVVIDDLGQEVEVPEGLLASKEIQFHLAIFKLRPQVHAVIHLHPPHATAYAVLNQAVPLATISAIRKLKQGPVVPEARPGSKELAANVGECLKAAAPEASVLLLHHHGIVTFGSTLEEAFNHAELAEDTAKIAYLTSRTADGFAGIQAGQKVVDLTTPLTEQIHCYPTDPPFKKQWHVEYPKAGMWVSKLDMGSHTGTHVDAPLHFSDGATTIAEMGPEKFFGPAIIIDAPKGPREKITPEDLQGTDIRAGDIVLFRTGWEERSSTPRFFEGEWPAFAVDTVEMLIGMNVRAIGGDIPSADSPSGISSGAPAHKKAAAAGLPIYEGLINLESLVGQRITFVGLPLRIVGGEASPIRAIAFVD